MINQARLVKLARQLIRIDSQNPPGNERQIARFIVDYLRRIGLRAQIRAFSKGRENVLAVVPGRSRRRSLLISPHLDTVPAGRGWKTNPFAGQTRAGRIYGLGATDCKGNLAAAIEALNSLTEEKARLDYSLLFAATADEESGSGRGLIPLLRKGLLQAEAALILDADNFEIIVTQKGLLHLKFSLEGKRSHGAYPGRGVNAIDLAIDALAEIKSLRLPFQKNKYLRPPTLNTGTIRGGDKVNIVADWCEVELDYRFLPGMRAQDFLKALSKILRRHTAKFKVEVEGIQRPYEISAQHPLVSGLQKSCRKYGVRPRVKGSEGATVITFFQEKKIPAVAFGFGSAGCAHSVNEYAQINNLVQGARVLEEFLRNENDRSS